MNYLQHPDEAHEQLFDQNCSTPVHQNQWKLLWFLIGLFLDLTLCFYRTRSASSASSENSWDSSQRRLCRISPRSEWIPSVLQWTLPISNSLQGWKRKMQLSGHYAEGWEGLHFAKEAWQDVSILLDLGNRWRFFARQRRTQWSKLWIREAECLSIGWPLPSFNPICTVQKTSTLNSFWTPSMI